MKQKGIPLKAGNSSWLESTLIIQSEVTKKLTIFGLFILDLGWKRDENDKSTFH